MSGEYDSADNYALLEKELEDCERVLINTRNLAADKAAEQRSRIAELEHQIITARAPGPATVAMLEYHRQHLASLQELDPSLDLNNLGNPYLIAVKAFLAEWSDPATPPEQPEPPSPWKCAICHTDVALASNMRPYHLNGPGNHEAELSDEDRKTLADGLRLTD